MRRIILLTVILLLSLIPEVSWARGGGGCLAEGTQVLTPKGPVAIERLTKGDPVWSIRGEKLQRTEVLALMKAEPEGYLEISAGRAKLEVTSEHPMMVAQNEYRLAGLLRAGDTVYLARDGRAEKAAIQSIRSIQAKQRAFNLLVGSGGTFIAAGFVVHNKGCFLPESQILKGDGTESRISAVKPMDELLAFTPDGRMVRTKVREITRHEVDEYMLFRTDRTMLRVTLDHPFYVGAGTFKTVEALKEGDSVFAWDGQWLGTQRIISMTRIHERVQVFNLQTDHPNTFFAGRVAVHNKGGCFPAGTKIATPNGPVAIETLSSGDEVLAVAENGLTVRTTVRTIFVSKCSTLSISTGESVLVTTEEHPVSFKGSCFRPAGEFRPGDHIVVRKGGGFAIGRVQKVSFAATRNLVFNLEVDEPHTFMAEGIVVHNKGGGSTGGSFRSGSSSSRSSSSGSSGDAVGTLIFIAIFAGIVVLFIVAGKRKAGGKTENLDFVYSRDKVAPKAGKTEKLLTFMSQQDPNLAPEELRKLAESTFRKLQECWQSRDYGPMKPLLMPDLFAQHSAQLQGLVRNHEINRIENLTIERVDLVNLRYTDKPDQREFTALITASARDYYTDDRTGKFLRGDKTPARFQEFWTFHCLGDRWLLREIEQAGESDVLKEENYVEMLTDDTIQGIYRELAGKDGAAGPWLEKKTGQKATRIDRMLNFLVQTDKLWNRTLMIEQARKVFLKVYLARESGDPGQVPAADLFPGVAESLRMQMRHWHEEELKVEYRNLCVRKVELIQVRNFADRSKDEFTVRISAHAQRITLKRDKVSSEQEYVTPFEEYWTFGRLDEQWKLKQALPPARGKKLIAEENVDEEIGPGQLQWYYRQPRAN